MKHELDTCGNAKVEFVELPLAFDAVTLIVNPGNRFVETLSIEQLRKMWEARAQGTLTRWNQIDARWPDAPLKLLGPARSSDEGRFFNVAVLKTEIARQDYMSSSEDAVPAQTVARDLHAIAYVSSAAFEAHRRQVKAIAISPSGSLQHPGHTRP